MPENLPNGSWKAGLKAIGVSITDAMRDDTNCCEEVEPRVTAILRLWDDRDGYAEQRRLVLAEAERWRPEALEPRYIQVFEALRAGRCPGNGECQAPGDQAAETSSEGPPSLRACHSSQE